MACCKNAKGATGNDERHPPRLIEQEKAKGPKKVLAKKCKHGDIEVKRATIVAAAAECAERGDRGSGVHIGEAQFHLEGRELGTKEIEQAAAEEPTPQIEQ